MNKEEFKRMLLAIVDDFRERNVEDEAYRYDLIGFGEWLEDTTPAALSPQPQPRPAESPDAAPSLKRKTPMNKNTPTPQQSLEKIQTEWFERGRQSVLRLVPKDVEELVDSLRTGDFHFKSDTEERASFLVRSGLSPEAALPYRIQALANAQTVATLERLKKEHPIRGLVHRDLSSGKCDLCEFIDNEIKRIKEGKR